MRVVGGTLVDAKAVGESGLNWSVGVRAPGCAGSIRRTGHDADVWIGSTVRRWPTAGGIEVGAAYLGRPSTPMATVVWVPGGPYAPFEPDDVPFLRGHLRRGGYLVVVDYCGRSEPVAEPALTAADMLAAVTAVVRAELDLGRKVLLVGHSFGASLALLVAARLGHGQVSVLALAPFASLDLVATTSANTSPTFVHHLQQLPDADLLSVEKFAPHLQGPVTLVHGLADNVVAPVNSRRIADALDPAYRGRATVRWLDGEGHRIVTPDGLRVVEHVIAERTCAGANGDGRGL